MSEEEKMNKNHPDYYRTFKWDIPDNETAANYIYGTHTGFSDREIPRLVDKILNGEIPDDIMPGLRVLALNAHNGFIRYNLEREQRIRQELNTMDLQGDLSSVLTNLIEMHGEIEQTLRNLRDKIDNFYIDKGYE